MRDLVEVIDSIVAVAPDLSDQLKSVRSSVPYTAPEMMANRWHEVAKILNDYAIKHLNAEEIGRIFSGA